MSSGVKKYNFNDEYPTTTVDLSQFAIPGDWLRNSYSYTTEVTISPGEYYITIVQEEGQTKSVEFISANNSAIGSSKFGDY
jgi:hypothetical protein